MAVVTRKRTKPTWQQVLRAAQALSPQDQRRLRDELTKQAGVHLVRPTGSTTVSRRGKRLAKTIQAELAVAYTGSLEETMSALRGQSWSS